MMYNNKELYRELSIPYKSLDDANKNWLAFCEELSDLRAKYRIRDLLFIARTSVADSDLEAGEYDTIVHSSFGDTNIMESLAAYTYGKLSAERSKMLGDFIKSAQR